MAKNIEYKLDHFGIKVNNLGASTRFYERNFGFQKIRESDKPELQLKLAVLQLGDFYLELSQPYSSKDESPQTRKESLPEILKKAPAHFAISVDALADMHTHLSSNGVEFATTYSSSSKNIFCYDPDGFLIEIKQR